MSCGRVNSLRLAACDSPTLGLDEKDVYLCFDLSLSYSRSVLDDAYMHLHPCISCVDDRE